MKQLLVALLPIIILLWVIIAAVDGIVKATGIIFASLSLSALVFGWIYLVCEVFYNEKNRNKDEE